MKTALELKQWRCFVTLAEIGNIRRAALLLALSQPALSMRIQRLEEELGYALFERQARGVGLTERGQRLLPHAQHLLARASETVESARAIGRGVFERIELGITRVAALSFFPEAARHFAATNSGVTVALTEALSDDLEKAVAQRRLDLAIVHPPSSRDDLVVKEIARERFVAVLPVSHRLATADSLDPADLRAEVLVAVRRDIGPVTFDRIVGYFSRAGVIPQISQCATSSISLVGLVAAGAGIGLVVTSLQCIRRSDIRFVPLAGEAPTLGYALCHRADLPTSLRVAFQKAIEAAALARSEYQMGGPDAGLR